MTFIEAKYRIACESENDMRDHIQFLSSIAHGNILELGVRDGNSTCAFLFGIERHGGHLWSVDKNIECAKMFPSHELWTFIDSDSTDVPKILNAGVPNSLNIILLDTRHDYDQVFEELQCWHTMVEKKGIILVHDVITYRNTAGTACNDFSTEYGWQLFTREGSHGLAILTRR